MINEDKDDISSRELAREMTRLARAIETLASEIKSEFLSLRKETVRNDVYMADRRTDEVGEENLERRIQVIELRAKTLTAALTGMLLTVVGSIVVFVITRGIL